ncbi:MAG: Gfo/Idh/MocA family oxidoreductase, partial [Pseudomonadota bacterium]
MSKRIGLAVVGVGMAAKPHALALKDLSHLIDVRGVYARSSEARGLFCETYGFPEADIISDLASDPTVDALLLTTPPNARSELISLFANQSKHILTEKPLERTTSSAETIVDDCNRLGVSLGVVFQHRFRAASEALTELLSKKSLGAVRAVNVQIPWWRDQSYYDEPGRGTY